MTLHWWALSVWHIYHRASIHNSSLPTRMVPEATDLEPSWFRLSFFPQEEYRRLSMEASSIEAPWWLEKGEREKKEERDNNNRTMAQWTTNRDGWSVRGYCTEASYKLESNGYKDFPLSTISNYFNRSVLPNCFVVSVYSYIMEMNAWVATKLRSYSCDP
jgi:hypothetical protein